MLLKVSEPFSLFVYISGSAITLFSFFKFLFSLFFLLLILFFFPLFFFFPIVIVCLEKV
ncbi:uncharacterized protein EV154DRAFT_510230 [Mucor mucedo]|uniref:uncharacterized protein n=1 Tax=Mucor mucedo TaxID=29922 RepID=UPI00221F9AEF|nr:uncharacterized protein EV154DRAFT_510230 [Mucor mucedo]KAI7890794.1 hypothetical protein EV154DRAFT_510230 [Mucor mucedo]